jgi:Crp-like helix-turn-helix domain
MGQKFCYIYKLSVEESLIIHEENNTNIYIILEGAIIISKVFTNQEILSLGILSSQDVIITSFNNVCSSNYFYQVHAISETYMISMNNKYTNYFQEIFSIQYKQTCLKYKYMIEVLAHKNIKHRLIQLLLNLSNLFSITQNKHIEINLSLSHKTISSIIGSNRNTLNQLMKKMQDQKLIKYTKKK